MNNYVISTLKIILLNTLFCLTAYSQTPDASNTLYVNINVTGGNGSGNSWANAIPQLSDALKYARLQYNANNAVYDAQPLKIFVAKGTYKPLYSARNGYFTQTGSADPAYSDQDNAFVMVKNVQIYGGFDPENNIDDLTDTRIFGANGSVLSGEIGIDDGNGGWPYDNARHIVIASGDVGNAVLNGFTIRDAYSEGTNQFLTVFIYPVQDAFGAMYCVRSSPTVENCIFTNNQNYGGTLFNYQISSPTVTNCTFIKNGVQNNGGAMFNAINCSPTITNCNFTNNAAVKFGGAIYNSDNSSPTITHCSFKNNSAGDGGVIYNSASSPIITNALFANNKATASGSTSGNGGAIYNETTSSPILTNVTIANNTGANTYYSTGAGSTTFNNSIVYGAVSASYTAQYSLVQGYAGGTNGNLDGTSITAIDVFNYFSGGNLTLKIGSPAVNAGSNALFSGLDGNTLDLLKNPRVYDFANGGIIDLGAYEFNHLPDKMLYVNINVVGGTGDGSSWENAIPQLADALKYARQQYDANNDVYEAAPLKIYVAKGTYKPLYGITNSNQDQTRDNAFVMMKNVQIYGGFDPDNGIDDLTDTRIFGANGSVLSGNIGDEMQSNDNTYHIVVSSNEVGNALLDGFYLTGAYSTSSDNASYISLNNSLVQKSRGAFACAHSSPTITNCFFDNNSVGLGGAGISNSFQSSPIITNCTFSSNYSAFRGGAIYNTDNSYPTITNCSFNNNSSNTAGGAIYNDVSSPVITNCSFNNNSSKEGGAVYNSSSSSAVTNTLFANNVANGGSGNGGAIYNEGTSSPVMTNVTIANNTGANTFYSTNSYNTTFNNSIVYGTISATYTAQHSLIEGNADFTNGNLDASGLAAADVFNDPTNEDFTLKSGASAINAGNNALNASTTDLAGNPRIQYATIDLGAYESSFASILPDVNGIVYVRPLAYGDGSGMNWANATSNLQGAIDGTNVQKVYVAIGNYPVGSSSYVMKNDVEIYGGFDPENGISTLADARILPTESIAGSVLDGLNTLPLIWNDNNALTATAILDGFTLMNGYGVVGAMYNRLVAPTYNNLVIRNNESTAGGGGIYNVNASIKLTNAIIANNTAQYGGGVRNNAGSNAEFTNVVIKNNTATLATGGAGGGGIFNENSNLKLTNVLIANNSTNRWGGGFRNLSGNPVFTNVTLVNNTAVNQPATEAMEIVSGTPQINNSIVFGTISGIYTPQYSLIEGNTDLTNGNVDAVSISTSDVFFDPSNQVYSIKFGAAAIDAGNTSLFPNLNASTVDLAGNPRVISTNIDMGAYEKQCVVPYITIDTVVACSSYTWIDGIEYTASNTTAQVITPSNLSCDTILYLNLTINYPTNNSIVSNACDSYTWNGTTYTTSGTYTYNYTNASGCSSTDTLHLTMNYGSHLVESDTVCDHKVWNGTTYTTSGTYTYNYTNASGCSSTDTLYLTIVPTSVVFSAVDCESYTWNGTTYTTSGIYTFDYTNSMGCQSTDTLHLNISSIDTTLSVSGVSITSNEVNASSYQWINCDDNTSINGATNQVFVATENGNYAVILSKGNCVDTSACILINDLSVSAIALNDWKVYPVPTSTDLTIASSTPMDVEILDMLGKKVMQINLKEGTTIIDVQSLTNGVYFVKRNDGESLKFIKE